MIPRNLFHIWVGESEPPTKWLQTWKDLHPEWNYTLVDNDYLFSHEWVNDRHIKQYYAEKKWHGVADLVRYELLHKFGGIVAPADSECLLPFDELLDNDCFTCPESDRLPDYIVPILGATQGNELVGSIIDKLHSVESVKGSEPWKTTGNLFIGQVVKDYPKLTLYPYYYFVPQHFRGWKYEGTDKIYCKQHFGTTRKCYDKGR